MKNPVCAGFFVAGRGFPPVADKLPPDLWVGAKRRFAVVNRSEAEIRLGEL